MNYLLILTVAFMERLLLNNLLTWVNINKVFLQLPHYPLPSRLPTPSPYKTFWGMVIFFFFWLHCMLLSPSVTKLPLKKKSFVISRLFSSLHHRQSGCSGTHVETQGNAFLLFMTISMPGVLPSQLAASFSLVCPRWKALMGSQWSTGQVSM